MLENEAGAEPAREEEARLRALRETLLGRSPVRPWIYWTDLLLTALVGWGAFTAAVCAAAFSLAQLVLLCIAALALLRGGFFVHEVAHQKKALPHFELAWNVLFGVPLLMPSFMMSAHADHHRVATFGTADDPEYEPLAKLSPPVIAIGVAAMVLVGPALVLRALAAPLAIALARAFPGPRRIMVQRLSSLVTNERYQNHHLRDDAKMRTLELACGAFAATVLLLCTLGVLPWALPLAWLAAFASAMVLNQLRTQVAHGYDSDGRAVSLADQVADSATVPGPWWSTGLIYPLGTRFHALHHLAPTLPYHAMPAAHRWLVEQLATSSSYRALTSPGHVRARAAMWRRAFHRASSRTLSLSQSKR